MGYLFLDHTADIKFVADGKTIEEAFSNAAYAMKEVVSGDAEVLPKIKKEISIEGSDYNNLLYGFLEEFLFFLDSEDFLFSKIDSIKIEGFKLRAEVSGDKGEEYIFTNDVKAVTYNDMFVEHNSEKGWSLQVVLDV